jgi:hypothetical protein
MSIEEHTARIENLTWLIGRSDTETADVPAKKIK